MYYTGICISSCIYTYGWAKSNVLCNPACDAHCRPPPRAAMKVHGLVASLAVLSLAQLAPAAGGDGGLSCPVSGWGLGGATPPAVSSSLHECCITNRKACADLTDADVTELLQASEVGPQPLLLTGNH